MRLVSFYPPPQTPTPGTEGGGSSHAAGLRVSQLLFSNPRFSSPVLPAGDAGLRQEAKERAWHPPDTVRTDTIKSMGKNLHTFCSHSHLRTAIVSQKYFDDEREKNDYLHCPQETGK